MGRNTFESLPTTLKNREMIVVSSNVAYQPKGATKAASMHEALGLAAVYAAVTEGREIVVASGAEIYAQTIPYARRMELTIVESTPDGDTLFPQWNRSEWNTVSKKGPFKEPNDEVSYRTESLERRH
jgi:dihydrofolate reductase